MASGSSSSSTGSFASFRPNPNAPIPNNPFYYPETSFLQGDVGQLIVGSGLNINYATGTISASGGGGGGAVNQVTGGTGITVSPTTGNVVVFNDGVLQLTAGAGITISGSKSNYTISSPFFGTVTSITAGSGLTGGIITSTGTLAVDGNVVLLRSLYTAKGQILVSTAAGTVSPLASFGTPNGHVLTVDSTQATNLKWAPLPTSVQTVNGTTPIQVTTGVNPVVTIATASTTQPGATTLVNDLTTNDGTKALTAAQGYALQQQISSLNAAGGLTLAGTLNAATGNLLTVTTSGTGAGFNVGSPIPAAAVGNKDYFVIVTTPGTYTPPGGSAVNATQGDWFNSTGTAWDYLNVGFDAPAATTSVAGIVCLATNGDAIAGTDSTKALTPAAGAAAYVPLACLTNKGTLITATAATTPTALAIGTDGQILTACSSCAGGMFWASAGAAGIPCAAITGKGAVLTGTAANNPVSLAVGLDGQFLAANSGAATGLAWCTPSYIPCSCITGKGALITGPSANNPTALPVGTDGQILSANSSAGNGLCWCTPNYIPCSIVTAKGGLIGATASGAPAFIPAAVGNCRVLISNSSCAQGVEWVVCPQPATVDCFGLFKGSIGNDSTLVGCLAINTGFAPVLVGSTVVGACTAGGGINISWCGICDTFVGHQVAGCVNCTCVSRFNTLIGARALYTMKTNSQGNTALGAGTYACVTGTQCYIGCDGLLLAAGYGLRFPSDTAYAQMALGWSPSVVPGNAQCYWLTGCCDKTIRPGAGILDRNGNAGTAGQQVLFSQGAAGIEWGNLPLMNISTPGVLYGCQYGINGLALGLNAANTPFSNAPTCNLCIDSAVIIGPQNHYLYDSVTGTVSVGANIMCNSAFGSSGLNNTYVGSCIGAGGTYTCIVNNVVVGFRAGENLNGSGHTILGTCAGTTLAATAVNNIVIGLNAQPSSSTVSNTVTLGNSSITTIRAAVTSITSLSDARDKTNVQALPVGIEFVKDLQPVTFQWQQREPNPVKDGQLEAGFIAQQLQEAQAKHGVDYLGLVNDDNPDRLEASPGKLIPVLVKALQDLTAAHERLRADFNAYVSSHP